MQGYAWRVGWADWVAAERGRFVLWLPPFMAVGVVVYVGLHVEPPWWVGAAVGGAGVVEVVTDFRGDTFRAVYTLRDAGAVYVLHAFQKKSKTGRETPDRDMDLIKQRLREAEQIAKEMKP